MTDPHIDFLKKHLGVSDGVAHATVHGGWPDVDSPDDNESSATEKNAKIYKHFVQDVQDQLEENAWEVKTNHAKGIDISDDDLKKMIDSPDELDHFRTMAFNHAVWRKALKRSEIEHYATNSTSRRVRRAASDVLKFSKNLTEDSNEENEYLEESKKDFIARYGTSDDIHRIIDSGEMYSAILKNPVFSREHHERLLHHSEPFMNHWAIESPHVTSDDLAHLLNTSKDASVINNAIGQEDTRTEDIKKMITDGRVTHDRLIANAINRVDARKAWSADELQNLVHRFKPNIDHKSKAFIAASDALLWHRHNKLNESFEYYEIEDFNSITLEESKEEFTARYGDAQHIDKLIDQYGTVDHEPKIRATLKNPMFDRQHHERLLNHKYPYMRKLALYSPHLTSEDIHQFIHHPENWKFPEMISDAISSKKGWGIIEPDNRTRIEDIKHVALNHHIDPLRANAITIVNSRNGWSENELQDLIKKLPDGRAKIAAENARAWHPDHILKKLTEDEEIPKIQAGIAHQMVPLEDEGKPPFTSYWLENKLIWVPTEHIIADAHETHEGLRHMGEEFVLFEDGMVKTWSPHEMADELKLSRSVHEHYKDAGINHYPYHPDNLRTSIYPRIKAVHDFNTHSRPYNDLLIRNFHNVSRSWDATALKVVNHIDSIFDQGARTTNPINTMSGLKTSPQEVIDYARSKGADIGDHIYLHLPAYTSTSTRFSTAAAFTKLYGMGPMVNKGDRIEPKYHAVHMFHIHVPANNKLIGLETHPDLENGNENELILPRDTILKVNTKPAVYQVNNHHVHVWMSEVAGTNRTPLKNV